MTVPRPRLEHLAILALAFPLAAAVCPPFRQLRELASSNPAIVLDCAPATPERQRDFLQHQAFSTAAFEDPALARRHLASVIDRPWISTIGFYPCLAIAGGAPPALGRTLMLAAARHNPSLALRDLASYAALPYSAEIFEAAALAAPDEAVGLAARNSAILDALRSSPALAQLAQLAADSSLPAFERERAAVFHRLPMPEARALARDDAFFPALVRLRLGADLQDAQLYDRQIDRSAQLLFRWFEDRNPTLARFSPVDIYMLLAAGRSEEDDRLFAAVFDKFLLPRLRGAALPSIRLRSFLTAAAHHHRLNAFLRAAGPGPLLDAMRGIESLDDALEASQLIDAVSRALRDRMAVALAAQPAGIFTSLLLTQIRNPTLIGTAAVYQSPQPSIQRHLFYPDDDGVESFESFKRAYTADPAWQWSDRGSFVQVSAPRVEIYANKPLQPEGQAAISRLLAERRTPPDVLVHRGHSYWVERSLPYLTAGTTLVYLGSCRALGVSAAVIAAAPRAHVILTRGVGTQSVNDPLLKAIADELRRSPSIDWLAFWRTQQSRFRGSSVFAGYIPPPLNQAARFAAAYYAALE